MPRPESNNASYFPHKNSLRNHRKVKILRNRFGAIQGYAFWCMMLEWLTEHDGLEWEFSDIECEMFAAELGVSAAETRDMVDLCLQIKLLYKTESNFIYSESLNEELQPVFDKRNRERERSKERLRKENGVYGNENPTPSGVSAAEIPQSRVEYSIVDKSIINTGGPPPPPPEIQKEVKKPKAKSGVIKFINPDLLPYKSTQFIDLWSKLLSSPKWVKKNDSAVEVAINKMKKYNEPFMIQLLESALIGQWQGLFFSNTDSDYQKFLNSHNNNGKSTFVSKAELSEAERFKRNFEAAQETKNKL